MDKTGELDHCRAEKKNGFPMWMIHFLFDRKNQF